MQPTYSQYPLGKEANDPKRHAKNKIAFRKHTTITA